MSADVDLIERTVTLHVSRDTLHLWEALAARLELGSFDALCQALCLYGAFLQRVARGEIPAQADEGGATA